MFSKIQVIGKKILKCLFWEILCIFIEALLSSFGTFAFMNTNILFITINNGLILLAIIIVLEGWLILQPDISAIHITLKKNREFVIAVLTLLQILYLYKCYKLFQFFTCIIEFEILMLLIDFETTKVFKYNFVKTKLRETTYIEKPVIGREMLTQSQCKALDELKSIIDNRKSNDSFNVALLGAWGSGKTSITDTLIYEYEKQDNRYFILKISTLTLKETKNIVTYVKNYFEDLFRKYEIGIAGRNVAFLATLANTFSEQLSINELFYNTSGNSFLDIEKERQFFVKQISNLLKVSGRKNILFLIDDTDRGEDEEQIIKLLSEFASIDGIISVVSLDKQKDISAYSSKMDKDNIYNYIDKFIHVRIRIIDDNHIEYNQNITDQILCSFEKIAYKTNCYIQCDCTNTKYSLYDSLKEYQTTEVVKKRVLSTSTYNILTEIFLYNLKYNFKNFGSYLEELIKEYIYNSKEIQPYIQEIITKPIDKWEKELLLISAQWTDLFKIQVEDSLMQLQNNFGNLFWTLICLIESLDMIENNEKIEKDIKNIRDVYEYLIIKKYSIDGRTWENRTEQEVSYTELQQLELVAFSKQQYLEINTYIEKGNYQKVKKLLIEKIEGVANLYFALFILNDFMDYVRNVLNNYRSFKMQLRETELINRNYLDYLIKDWQPRENILENFQKNNAILQNINIIVPSLDTFINNILFQNYILKYGEQFYNGEIGNSKLFLYHVKNSKPLIVIVKERKGQREYLYLDISGNKCELDEDLKTEIRKNYNELMD